MNLDYIKENNKIKFTGDDGFYELHHDKLALELFLEEVKKKSLKFETLSEKISFLIENKYYIDFLSIYSLDQIISFYNKANSYNFKFQSFMAASLFYKNYALKSFDGKHIIEDYNDRVVVTSMFLADGDINYANSLIHIMMTQQYQPATPTFSNAGLYNSGELVSCFLLDIDDSLNSITYNISTAMQLSKIGGGVALNLSKLRARFESVKGNAGAGKGVLPVMKLLEDSFSYVDQLGKRPGAGAVYLNIFHGDVIDFLDTKKINADEKSRIQTLSIGLLVPDIFMRLVKEGSMMHFFYPKNVYDVYKQHLDEMDLNEMYDILVNDDRIIKKQYDARHLMQTIAMTQFESGYPYLVFIDNANNQNPLKDIGKIKMSNLCTEIFQVQETSEINDYGIDDVINNDISCNLGSLNIVNLMENNEFENTIKSSIRALSSVSNASNIQNAPGINKANNEYHSIGLGVMNLNGYLAKNNIMFESPIAVSFVDILFRVINYYSLLESMNIAKEKNERFKDFEKSEYAKGTYFDMYTNEDFKFENEKVEVLFDGIYIPSKEDFLSLKKDVQKYGLYNAYRLAIAPTQSISYIQNSTASIMPIVDKIETRMYGESVTYYPMPYLSKENTLYYKSAYNMDQMKIIDVVASIQKHVDQGISLILYMTNENSTKDLVRLYYYAWMKGLKSIYYVRTKNLNVDECESCSV